jgi:hypothetical protein
MKITFMPDVDKSELIYGFQITHNDYALDLYLCFSRFKFEIFRIKKECWGVCLGVINIQGTNLRNIWED